MREACSAVGSSNQGGYEKRRITAFPSPSYGANGRFATAAVALEKFGLMQREHEQNRKIRSVRHWGFELFRLSRREFQLVRVPQNGIPCRVASSRRRYCQQIPKFVECIWKKKSERMNSSISGRGRKRLKPPRRCGKEASAGLLFDGTRKKL